MHYLLIFILFLGIEMLYFKIANKFNIIDKPNSRSSHTAITLRGGGIIFPLALLIAFILGYTNWSLTLVVVLVGTVSFIDDIKPIAQLPRFVIHFIAFLLIFYDLDLFEQVGWLVPIVFFLGIGWVNAFNFMDGINGITVLYALVAMATFAYLPIHTTSLPLLFTMIIAGVVFGIFNLRKRAKTFAGDVGSISMAVFLGYFMIETIVETKQFGYLLFFAVYGIDASFTIIFRLLKKENIFQAHRSHLYQYLANEMKFKHIVVSIGYAIMQLIINIGLLFLDAKGILSLGVSFGILLILSFIYLMIRQKVNQKIVLT